ncbi:MULTISPECIES: transporter substrate-binding domain-containing protein [Desulfococcus]|uniref:ABC-type transporter, periplasmic subunit family 3 n=1 Tax=Desulfococcus multivorans DSM 2059 TaxID=1121405 RepID=S7U0E3_DESML|nr:transporter substrate-binding domain-containing protein [Desulfococcus multivorans]AOY57008.1 polar amino acid ABC transpoter, substrate-binding protein [Desulfococcus multivorans]AQU99525.1 amino acid ABC transporter substrate-binding protein [Desulfococcus multivorans]EPR42896.1 ABC-type transporter, periplasmic subunit family 3 [Desulfococcus multivorans DSM 2059]SJZ89791.1 amino acid ABC transporter substrate-binding protein, PAAT family [Desulfococcus multivorans DSM 2059]
MKKTTIFLQAALLLVLAAGMAGSAAAGKLQQELVQESTLEQVLKRGVLRVGMDTFEPWAMKDKNGNFIGFEIDVAKRLAEDMGVKVEFVPTKWSGIIPALLTGKFDVIIGGMGIRPQRALKVNFSIPYDYSGMAIVAHKEKAAGFKSLEDFNKPEVQIACKLGTTAVMAAKKFIPKATLRLFDDEAQAYQELRNGNVHAVVGSAPRPAYETLAYSDTLFLPIQGTFTKEPIGFALRKGDFDTLTFFNSWITHVTDEGWLAEKHHYWFDTRDWANLIQ